MAGTGLMVSSPAGPALGDSSPPQVGVMVGREEATESSSRSNSRFDFSFFLVVVVVVVGLESVLSPLLFGSSLLSELS